MATVEGIGGDFVGVVGTSRINIGVHGLSGSGEGVLGRSTSSVGVEGISQSSTGVWGLAGSGVGVDGASTSSTGVFGRSSTGLGVHGRCFGSNTGVFGHSGSDQAQNDPNIPTGWGVDGHSPNNVGVHGGSIRNTGVWGTSDTGLAVHGRSRDNTGVWGLSDNGIGVVGTGPTAGRFEGPVIVTGKLRKLGGGFHVDHPNDPANKYLNHSFVESSEMKNVYDGVAQLDQEGAAWVDLPEWFEALNGGFRYQLTAVGGAAPNLHVAEEISENRFKIAGGEGGMKVCWQVTGSRKDPWAAANPMEVEEEKPQEERGCYLQPDLYGAPEDQSVMRARMGEMREPPQLPQIPQLPGSEPPQPPAMLPGLPEMPTGVTAPSVGGMEDEQRRQIAELRGQIEELRRDRLEEEIDDLRRQVKKLRRRRR